MWGIPVDVSVTQSVETLEEAGASAAPRNGKKPKDRSLKTAAELSVPLGDVLAQIAQVEKQPVAKNFERRLGEALQRKQAALSRRLSKKEAVAELMRTWDKNGDGEISRAEFRLAVTDKKNLHVQASTAEIDALFDSFDADKGGSLDLSELKPCLQALQDAVAASLGAEMQAQIVLNALRARADALSAAKQTMEEHEAKSAELAQRKSGAHLATRVASELKDRNISPQAALDRTTGKGDPKVDLAKFLWAIDKLNLAKVAPTDDFKKWYGEEYDIECTEPTLASVLQRATARRKEEVQMEKQLQDTIKTLYSTARRQQALIDAKAAKETEKAQRADELRAAAEIEAAEKEEKAREAKRNARADREAKAAREKQAFEERVRQRRASGVVDNGVESITM